MGNVLIDGQRLGAKSQSLRDVLGRVAAREVVRIEVLRGSAVAGDASGRSVLANVIRTPASGGGTWEAGFELTNRDKPTPNGKFGWSGRKEATEFSVGGSAFTHDHVSAGNFVMRDGAGDVIERRYEGFPHQNGEYALNGQVSVPAGDGKLTFTGQLAYFRHEEQFFRFRRTLAGTPLASEDIPYSERDAHRARRESRGSAPVGEWDMNLTALATRERGHWNVTANSLDAAGNLKDVAFQRASNESGESIVRSTFAKVIAVRPPRVRRGSRGEYAGRRATAHHRLRRGPRSRHGCQTRISASKKRAAKLS